MKTRLALCLSVLVALVGCVHTYDFEVFQREINDKCLSRWWTNQHPPNDMKPVGMSLNSFLAMVEKVENNHTDWDIYRVTKELLKRFAFEEIIFKDLFGKRIEAIGPIYKNRWNIISKLLPDDQMEGSFREDDLSEEEKCTMYFMMGHLANDTYRSDKLDGEVDVPLESQSRAATKVVRFPREQGVISINGYRNQAVAISKVLNAIIASQSEVERSIGDIIPNVGNKNYPKDLKIKADIGVTLGDVLSQAVIYNQYGTTGARFFGPGGVWNHGGCPIEFTLDGNITGVTNALLRGAVDGILVARAIKSWGDEVKGLKLSRVLRTYYSPRGLPIAYGMLGVSYCRRQELETHIGRAQIKQSSLAYYFMHVWKEHDSVFEQSPEKIENAINQMIFALKNFDQNSETDECRLEMAEEKPVCETPTNVFAILDNSGKDEELQEQEYVIGELASKIKFGTGTLSVLFSRRKGDELERVSYNDTNPTCATCRITWLDKTNRKDFAKREDEVTVLGALDKTLQNFAKSTEVMPGVPSKVSIMFHNGRLLENDKIKVKKAADALHNKHIGARLFVVGEDEDLLLLLTRVREDVITGTNHIDLVNTLQRKICNVPANFQFKEKEKYTGYVTPDHVQFWAFQQKSYAKCKNVVIKFVAEQGDLIVCNAFGEDNPGFSRVGVLDDTHCKKTDHQSPEITFNYGKPCGNWRDPSECLPINFAVIGKEDHYNSQYVGCDQDSKCQKMDQVKFTVSLEECANTVNPTMKPTSEAVTVVPTKEPGPPDAASVVGPVSKATLFCKEKISQTDTVGLPTAGGCTVMCLTDRLIKLVNVPDGLVCKDGKGICEKGLCMAV